MNQINRAHRGERGYALILVACLLFISVGLVVAILDYATNNRRISQEQLDMEQAMFTAEAGLEYGAWFLKQNILAVVQGSGTTNGSGTIISGTTTGTYKFYVTKVGASTYSLISTGMVYGGHSAYYTNGTNSPAAYTNAVYRTVRLLNCYQPTYAQFALWTHLSNGLAYKAGEWFNGHVHADDMMTFNNANGGPVFSNVVSTLTNVVSNGSSTTWTATNGIYFGQGFLTNTYEGSMADVDFSSTNSTSLKNFASSQGLLLTGRTTITFNGASVKITNGLKNWTNYVYNFVSTNGLIYVQTTNSSNAALLYLNGGNVTGRLTLVSDTNMFVQGNITYTTNPQVTNSTDALALIAKDNIIINTNAPSNLQLQAAVMVPGTNKVTSGVTNSSRWQL